jgi:hypothetical protein
MERKHQQIRRKLQSSHLSNQQLVARMSFRSKVVKKGSKTTWVKSDGFEATLIADSFSLHQGNLDFISCIDICMLIIPCTTSCNIREVILVFRIHLRAAEAS